MSELKILEWKRSPIGDYISKNNRFSITKKNEHNWLFYDRTSTNTQLFKTLNKAKEHGSKIIHDEVMNLFKALKEDM